jgi:hypothetical protein
MKLRREDQGVQKREDLYLQVYHQISIALRRYGMEGIVFGISHQLAEHKKCLIVAEKCVSFVSVYGKYGRDINNTGIRRWQYHKA